jgi:hypothetical protein
MAVTAAPARQGTRIRGFQEGKLSGQPAGKKKFGAVRFEGAFPVAHSTGITISLGRTIFRRVRAAASIVRGSVRSRSISSRRD